jgi:hypothetical protein
MGALVIIAERERRMRDGHPNTVKTFQRRDAETLRNPAHAGEIVGTFHVVTTNV